MTVKNEYFFWRMRIAVKKIISLRKSTATTALEFEAKAKRNIKRN
jgi:hypothetical protein